MVKKNILGRKGKILSEVMKAQKDKCEFLCHIQILVSNCKICISRYLGGREQGQRPGN